MSAAPALEFAGHSFVPLADRALFWPRHGALIVADLHLEKASWYAAHGQPLPPYDSHDTLDRLARLATGTGARAIWCLGDSFHDRDAATRIAAAVAARLDKLAAAARILWIAGNHDGLSGGAWGGEVADELIVDGVVLRHQSERTERRPEISGHFHPKLRRTVRGRSVARPCFAGDAQRLILPAFGSLTGGLDVDAAAIAENFPREYRAMLVANGRLLTFPCGGGAADDATASAATAAR
ncbi:ligase-associated DNA damage response endonuclease PdeM [Sphingopyxis indica]|uniref:ligase-associated DNA damage response endonuclease PdeM n=1 Tax=Sphingopyxis indica TaxID=436663 RepID=UPI00293940AE|nr:ligase-associated DNA damage response endonuclease PdeM [Sphingopyxis indica]WOF43229.1 ligase-associated DNA damage response endonuclease PdeM [Sphingopyxis indica]